MVRAGIEALAAATNPETNGYRLVAILEDVWLFMNDYWEGESNTKNPRTDAWETAEAKGKRKKTV
jgi:hypothetical protein